MGARYIVTLSDAERSELGELISRGKPSARRVKRAQILLAAERGQSEAAIAKTLFVGTSTVHRTRSRFVLHGLEAALCEEPRRGVERKLSGNEEALLVAVACSKPPPGRARWTLELLAGELIRRTEHESVSRETIRRRLAENDLKPWRRKMWCTPKVDSEYVARMEDVLELYAVHTPNHRTATFEPCVRRRGSQPWRPARSRPDDAEPQREPENPSGHGSSTKTQDSQGPQHDGHGRLAHER